MNNNTIRTCINCALYTSYSGIGYKLAFYRPIVANKPVSVFVGKC